MINYVVEGVSLPNLDYDKLNRWIEMVASSFGLNVGSLTYCFCDDKYILDVNRRFLNHDYYTDIITFDYTRSDKIGGDMVISLDTVRSNAEQLGADFTKELLRVIIHGVLHLCGIDDKGPGEREIMEQEENKALSLYEF